MGTAHFLNWVEGQAHGLRTLSGVGTFDRLDPFQLAGRMEVGILRPGDIAGLAGAVCEQLLLRDSTSWSAGSLHLPDGRKFVVLNPTHEETRQRASLMEELAHIHLRHKPTQLISSDGLAFRSYNRSMERQAYAVGAAALVPRRVLKGARTLGMTLEEVAAEHGVSTALVRFRQNILGIHLKQVAADS